MRTTVLVAEDEDGIRDIIVSSLERIDVVVEIAHDGQEAFEKWQQNSFDILISDVRMPRMDGYDLCRQIRQNEDRSSIYIILLTSLAAEDQKIEGLDSGADDYVTKPFRVPELLARVRVAQRVVGQSRQLASLTSQLADQKSISSMNTIGSAVAHELNSPLGAIGFNTRTLLKRLDQISNPTSRELFKEILEENRSAIGHMTHVTEALRSLYGFDFSDACIEIDPLPEVNVAITLLSFRVQAGVSITVEGAEDISSVVFVRSGLTQIMINLLSNALDSVGVEGDVRVLFFDTPEYVRIQVVDNGPKIEDDHRSRLFDPHFTTKVRGQGVGLGLDICRRLVERHGGRLKLDRSTRSETSFSLELPKSS